MARRGSGTRWAEETALQGIAFGAATNALARLLAFARQLLITASLGLASGLDAFFVAYAFVTALVFPIGDLFDSVVLPELVRTDSARGRRAHAASATAVLRVGVAAGAVLALGLAALAPLVRYLAPGGSESVQGELMRQVVILCPFALGFIAYRGLGAVLRSVRKFRAYYLGELAVAAVALLALWPFRREVTSVPLSLAVAFALGAILLWFPARPLLASTRPSERVVDWQALVRSALAAAPIYLCVQSLVVVERFFASFLAEGAISALGFAQLLAVVVPTTLAFETVLLTPLAEGSDRGFLLSRAASAALLVGLPIAVFGWCEASALVDLLFGRGRFDAAAVAMTGEAFRWAALGVPALLSWPVLTRALQVVGRYGEIARLGAGAVVLTVVLDAVVVFVCGGGVGALAAVSAAVGTVTVVGGIRALAGAGIELSTRGVRSAFGVACVAGAAAWATALSPPAVATLPLVGRGVLFCGVYAAVALSVPSREIAILRELVEHSFPALRRRGAGTGV